jgi:hypothetical protein
MSGNSRNHKKIVALSGLVVMLCANLFALGEGGEYKARAEARHSAPRVLDRARHDGNAQTSNVFEYLFSFRHDDIVTCAAFSKDGRWLATGSELGTVLITDIESKREIAIRNPDSRDNGVQALRFSPDGQFLVIGGFGNKRGGGQIRFLRTSDYSPAMSFDVPGDKEIFNVDVSPQNNWLIAAGISDVWVWNLANKRIVWQRAFERSALRYDRELALLFAAEPEKPAVISGQITFLNIANGRAIRTLRTPIKEPIRRLVMATSKLELFVLTDGAIVYRLNSATGAIKQRISLSDLDLKVGPNGFHASYYTDFEVLDDYPIFVFSNRQNTLLMNYVTRKLVTLDHGSQVGFKFNARGRNFALLGGVKDGSLSGVPSQHYWTVSVFSFKPF